MSDDGELSDSEGRFRTILEHAPVMIDGIDSDGTVVLWNRECERRLGWTAAEVAAMDEPLKVFYPDPELRAVVLESVVRADGQFREYEVVAKDGSIRIQMWADFKLPNGKQLSVGHDVTEQRTVEAQLRQSQKMEALGSLTGGIAHDFNNLLTIIYASAGLADRALETDPQRARDALEEVKRAAERGADLVRRLMSFARGSPLRRRPLVLDEALASVLPTLRRVLPESLTLETDLESHGAVVRVDPVALEQILINLLTNARDAIDGAGRIVVSTQRIDGADAHVVLAVSDDGGGMPPEVRERVLDPFFTTKAVGHGTGLGLPTVYGLVEQHEGSLELISALGQGTTVTVTLPLCPMTPVRGLVRPTLPAKRGQGEVVLLVEDEPALRATTAECLSNAGYEVVQAVDGEHALALALTAPRVDLVLSDVVMPRLSGPELDRRLRESGKDVRVAFVTGYTRNDLSDERPVLAKPWTPETLSAFVRRCLDR